MRSKSHSAVLLLDRWIRLFPVLKIAIRTFFLSLGGGLACFLRRRFGFLFAKTLGFCLRRRSASARMSMNVDVSTFFGIHGLFATARTRWSSALATARTTWWQWRRIRHGNDLNALKLFVHLVFCCVWLIFIPIS